MLKIIDKLASDFPLKVTTYVFIIFSILSRRFPRQFKVLAYIQA